ncbi:MAG: 23S rRNA (pseudouridine(1915)-N(3))-methyltransferase RlmH [Gemmatimonadaceae bacterium]
MRFLIVSVGRPRDRALAAAIHDYETRAGHYWPLETKEVREEPARSASADLVREREGTRLLDACEHADVIACDAGGAQMTSREFADWMREARETGRRDVAFLLGGAFGLSDVVRARARSSLGFCRWTLPHELARLVLAEQLYRAGTISRGEPYHK